MKRDRKPRPAYQQGLLRFAIAFVTWFSGVGYLTSITHMAFVAHSACAEHGELVHVQSAAPGAGMAQGSGAPARLGERTAVVSDEHDHCAAAATRPFEARAAHAAA